MMDEADATLVTSTSVLVRGQLRWCGCLIECPWHFPRPCGNTRGWMLHLSWLRFPGGHSPGVYAELGCPRCLHRSGHVLAYPEMVEALAAAAHDAPVDEADALRVLAGIGWRPHALDWEFPDPDDDSVPAEFRDHGKIKGHVPWEDYWPSYRGQSAWDSPWAWWRDHWPDLMTAVAGHPEIPRPRPPEIPAGA